MDTLKNKLYKTLLIFVCTILGACDITETESNSVPLFANSSHEISVQENSVGVIYTAIAIDIDGDSIIYSLSGGADSEQFTIGSSSGELEFISSPDYDAPTDSNEDNVYEVQISASDDVDSSSMVLKVTVTEVVETGDDSNQAPNASISVSPDPDTTTLTTITEVMLNGTSSSDPDDDNLSYSWTQPRGQSIDLSSTTEPSTTFTATSAGSYTFTLTVSDGEFDVGTTVTLEIVEANRVPTASISVSPDPENTALTTSTEITLSGSYSGDSEDDDLSYSWAQPSGQSIDLSSTTEPSTTFTATAAGSYTFTLTVSDSDFDVSTTVTLEIVEANRAPTASISVSPDPENTTLTTSTEITLSGSYSGDSEDDDLSYSWSQPSGQSIYLSSTTEPSTTFTATAAGSYTFTLTVSDGEFDVSTTVTLEIVEANRAPTASISVSPDPETTTLTTSTEVTLIGSYSGDSEDDDLSYFWTQPSGQSIDLSSTTESSTTFTATAAGSYTFTLTVSDGDFDVSTTVTLEIVQANRAPTASISVSPDPENTTLTTSTEVRLSGSYSGDSGDDDLSYSWSQPSGQSIDLSSTTEPSTTFTATAAGSYIFTLTVSDGDFDVSTTVTLEIVEANRAPTASISVSPDPEDTTLTTSTEITLNGSASDDPDGDSLNYYWSQPSGQLIPLSSTTEPIIIFSAAEAGNYTFTLTVSDDEFEVNTTVSLEIVVQANHAPIAKIRVSPSAIMIPTETQVTLDGSDSNDPDGDDLNYSWSQPSDQLIELNYTTEPSTTFTATIAGVYTFTLTVNDGEFEADTKVTLVIFQENRAPIASISISPDPETTNITTDTEVTLSGSNSSDLDDDILIYTWSQPANQDIDLVDISWSDTKFSASRSGSYTFTLTVSDGELEDSAESIITIDLGNILPDDFSDTARSTRVTLTWTEYSNDTTYNVYRSTDPNCDLDNYSLACSAAAGALFNDVASGLVDTNLSKDTTYYYWIEAIFDGVTQRAASPISATLPTGILNDTGIEWAGGYTSGNNNDCALPDGKPQDCHRGRDFTHNDDTDGRVGFSFARLNADGDAYTGTGVYDDDPWFCVRDNVTGLVWEVKTNDKSEHDKDNGYRWGGKTAIGKNAIDYEGEYYDDWDELIDAANSKELCGFDDWRAPDIEELRSIVDYSRSSPSIDEDYFPNTPSQRQWSASPDASNSYSALVFDFSGPVDTAVVRYVSYPIRLVRSGL